MNKEYIHDRIHIIKRKYDSSMCVCMYVMPYIYITKKKGREKRKKKKKKIELHSCIIIFKSRRIYHISHNNNQIDSFILKEHNFYAMPESK